MASHEPWAQKAAGGEEESLPQYTRGHWRPSEDDKLRQLVARHGPQNWNLIAQHLHGRSGKSCRLRWFNQLDPRINRAAFSAEEERRLVAAHRLYGNKWACIARLFPGRTDNAVKNHWHVIKARHSRRHHHQKNADPAAAKPNMQSSSSPSSHVLASSSRQLGEDKSLGKIQEQIWLPLMPRKLQSGDNFYGTRITPQKLDRKSKNWHLCDSKSSDDASIFFKHYTQIRAKPSNGIEDFEKKDNEKILKEVSFIDFLGVGQV